MTLVVPDIGEVLLLQYIVNATAPDNPLLHLYTNNLSPNEDTPNEGSAGGPTEATASGYAAISLTSWTTTLISGDTATAILTGGAGVTFSLTEGQDIYGYYVTDASNNLLWIERFPGAPFSLPVSGGDIVVIPQIEAD